MSTISADEVLAKNIAAMGDDLGELFTALSTELTFLYWLWEQFADLYLANQRRFEVMNTAAPFFFWLLQRSWWDETLLAISRLVATPKSMGQSNLTFQRLPDLITDTVLRANVETLIRAAVDYAEFAKTWRNKRIAHRDLALALKRPVVPLPSAGQKHVEKVLEGLAEILNEIQGHFSNSSTMYRKAPVTHGALDMLYVLRDGIRLEKLRHEHLDKNDYCPEEWHDDEPSL